MKKSRRLFVLGWLALGVTLAAADDAKTSLPKPPPLPPQAREISIQDAEKLMRDRKDITVLDVRAVGELNREGHLPGAKQLDYFSPDFDKLLPTLGIDVSKPVIVYCEFGGRARRAAQHMAKFGCREILIPAGGFNAWKKAGKTIEGAPAKARP